ncbi:hypothetical protein [Nonomuraea sp. NPDC049709]|uniref:hypothetical protein n=1 Tax=Nonomuraea sp. NPDC049709 TaxID=3154736 RepID=UPI00343F4A27
MTASEPIAPTHVSSGKRDRSAERDSPTTATVTHTSSDSDTAIHIKPTGSTIRAPSQPGHR